jgi:putative tryptophan/tyrosine transport system substrate-binding protein
MRRREFITLVGGAAAGWSLTSHAQQPKTPIVGYLSSSSRETENALYRAAFHEGLAELGFVEGRNVTFLYRYADGQYERLPGLAAELVANRVDIIMAGPSSPAAVAAKNATSTIPIVFRIGADPVSLGIVASYNKPGGNATGINVEPDSLTPKRIELLDRLVPQSRPVGELINPTNTNKVVEDEKTIAAKAARELGRELLFFGASTRAELASAFDEMTRKAIGGLNVQFEAFFTKERDLVIFLANEHRIPTLYGSRYFTDVGGFSSYGPDAVASYRELGTYVGKVLQGTRPSDLPVITPTKFYLVINLKAAKAIGLTVPPELLSQADEVIE